MTSAMAGVKGRATEGWVPIVDISSAPRVAWVVTLVSVPACGIGAGAGHLGPTERERNSILPGPGVYGDRAMFTFRAKLALVGFPASAGRYNPVGGGFGMVEKEALPSTVCAIPIQTVYGHPATLPF